MEKDTFRQDKVLQICQRFVVDQKITCPECIYQSDRVIENAYQFIQELCDVVGYYDDPGEDQ